MFKVNAGVVFGAVLFDVKVRREELEGRKRDRNFEGGRALVCSTRLSPVEPGVFELVFNSIGASARRFRGRDTTDSSGSKVLLMQFGDLAKRQGQL